MELQDKAFKNFKRNVNIQENIIAGPRVLLVNLDQLKKKIISDQLAKITPIFIWEGNKSSIYNYPQSHFTSEMTKRHLWRVFKILMLLGMLNHSVKNIILRFIAFWMITVCKEFEVIYWFLQKILRIFQSYSTFYNGAFSEIT